MANTTTSPNMNLPIPTVGTDPGPDWSTNVNACLTAVDSHNHSSGQGVQITPSGINVNADFAMNVNNLITARSLRFTAQGSPIALATDLGCLYVSGSDLYYNDEAGNQVRITQGGSVSGSTGTITGLPSGTASASFSAATFTFQSATSTPATMAVGPLVIGRAAASPKTVTLTPNAAQAANYGLIFPTALPGSTLPVAVDSSGNIGYATVTGSGDVVLSNAPTFSGNPQGTIIGDTFSPTITWTKSSGAGTTIFVQTLNRWYYTRIGPVVQVAGLIVYTYSTTGGTTSYGLTTTIPVATASLSIAGMYFSTGTPVFTARMTSLGAATAAGVIDFGFADGVSSTVNVNFQMTYIIT